MTHRGLLVGVDATRFGHGLFGPLPGAVSDVATVERLARARGVDCLPLRGPAATAAALKDELFRLADVSEAGDLVLFYFSGHGWRYRDVGGDEPDGFDESLVCADLPVEDDWFGVRFWPRVKPGSGWILIVDACHSESAVLGFNPNRAPAPAVAEAVRIDEPWRLMLTACRDKEIALELAGGDSGGGVVTTTMSEILDTSPTLSHQDLWTQVAAGVRDGYGHRGAGTPRITSLGPDPGLLLSPAMTWRPH